MVSIILDLHPQILCRLKKIAFRKVALIPSLILVKKMFFFYESGFTKMFNVDKMKQDSTQWK